MRPIEVHLTQEQIETIFGKGVVKDCWAILNEEDRTGLFMCGGLWSVENRNDEPHVSLNDCGSTFIEFTNGVCIAIDISEWGNIRQLK